MFRLLLSIALLFVALFLWNQYLYLQPLYDGYLFNQHIKEPVAMQIDEFGIPFIKAENENDAFYSLGWIHAQERLFQIDLLQRIANGKLSEIIPVEGALKSDKLYRTLGVHRYYKNKMNTLKNPHALSWFNAYQRYVDGINAFVASDRLPLEFKLLNYKPGPYEVIDFLPIAGYMALSFSPAMKQDALVSILGSRLKKEEMLSIFPDYPMEHAALLSRLPEEILGALEGAASFFPAFEGSNSWMLSPSKMENNKVLLANDPHIAYSNPAIWFEAVTLTPEFKMHGFYLPGVPFALLGESDSTAWGLTMLMNDDMDLIEEEVNLNQLDTVAETGNLKKHLETIQYGKETVKFPVYEIENRPIINSNMPIDTKSEHAISLAWFMTHPQNKIFQAFYEINRSKQKDLFHAAVSKIKCPGLNISMVDSSGNTHWKAGGLLQKHENTAQGKHIIPRKEYSHEELPFSYNPGITNPEDGVQFTANGAPFSRNNFEGYFHASDRSARIKTLLYSRKKFTLEQMQTMQNDNLLSLAIEAKPLINVALKPAPDGLPDEIRDEITEFNGIYDVDSIGANLFHQTIYELLKSTAGSLMTSEEFKLYCSLPAPHHFLYSFFRSASNQWNGKKKTELIQNASLSAYDFLIKRLGTDSNNWIWGNVHKLNLEHPLGKFFPLTWLYNIQKRACPGVEESINSAGGSFSSAPYLVKSGPSTRRLVQLKTGEQPEILCILPTGNSGNPFSKHYSDQSLMYLRGKYRKIKLQLPNSSNQILLFPQKF